MASLDLDYKNSIRSFRCHLGSLGLTGLLFTAIASTGISLGELRPTAQEPKPIYYIPPPKEISEEQASTPKSARSLDTFSIDVAYEEEPVDIALNKIDVSLDPDVNASLALSLDIDTTFEAARPQTANFENVVIYERSEVDEKPRIAYASEPKVPYHLRGEQVELVVFYYITAKGRTDKISVLDSSSDRPEYAELAKGAIKNWRFRPARKDGRPVACWVQQTFRFNRGSTSPFSIY